MIQDEINDLLERCKKMDDVVAVLTAENEDGACLPVVGVLFNTGLYKIFKKGKTTKQQDEDIGKAVAFWLQKYGFDLGQKH